MDGAEQVSLRGAATAVRRAGQERLPGSDQAAGFGAWFKKANKRAKNLVPGTKL